MTETTTPVFPLSIPFSDLKFPDKVDAIVVGSGYGGSIAAARLAEAGYSVCLLERGREILPGQYPLDLPGALEETQITTADAGLITPKDRNGLLDIRINDDMNVIVGCGLGGTSLINANVALRTDPKTFWQTDEAGNYFWPDAFRKGTAEKPEDPLTGHYEKAETMLGSVPLPDAYHPNKLKALEVSAKSMGQPCDRPRINVTFTDRVNEAGVKQPACTLCGDCCSGCNYGSKNTTLMNYLPWAARHGAQIVTEARVKRVTGQDGAWTVVLDDLSDLQPTGDPVEKTLSAGIVVLAAGTLGSTQILLASACDGGLALSGDRLGRRFSGNGDVLGFGFDANWQEKDHASGDMSPSVWGIGAGAQYPLPPALPGENSATRPGPCITGVIKVAMDEKDPVASAAVIEEGVGPGALSMVYPALFMMSEALYGQLTRFPDTERRLKDMQALGNAVNTGEGISSLSYTGAMSRTQSFLLMSHDSSGGRIRWNDALGFAYVDWPGVGTEFPYKRDNELLRQASDAIWANYLPNPMWHPSFGNKLITVHPVGGCCMGADAAQGVVDADCRVFTGNGADVHEGLLVCDGAVMPTSLGLNPLLTISAVTERAMEALIAAGTGKSKPAAGPAPQLPAVPQPQPEVAVDHWGEATRVLEQVKLWLTDLRGKLVAEDWSKAAGQISDTLKAIAHDYDIQFPDTAASIWEEYFKHSYEGEYDMKPAIDQVMRVLDPLVEIFRKQPGDYASVLEFLQDQLGDFSPGLSFDETMAGFVDAPAQGATGLVSDPVQVAARRGAAQGKSLVADFRVSANSIAAMLADPTHPAGLDGTITWARDGKTGEPFTLKGGTFNLLQQDGEEVETWLMIYTGTMSGAGGESFDFRGVKTLRRREGSTWWQDLTTLSVTISDPAGSPEPVAVGIITLGIQDFLKQLQTITAAPAEVDNSVFVQLVQDTYPGLGSEWDRIFGSHTYLEAAFKKLLDELGFDYPPGRGLLEVGVLNADLESPETRQKIIQAIVWQALKPAKTTTTASSGRTASASDGAKRAARHAAEYAMQYYQLKFAAFFANLIFRSYGGMLAYLDNFPQQDKAAGKVIALPAANGAPLRNLPQVRSRAYDLRVKAGVTLRMIRYNGGSKGPVILAPGFATSSQSYVMETVDMNLVEYLCAGGYDVWLFDYRGSPALGETSLRPFTIDDIAREDWPAAVDFVLETAGVKQVQVMVHCMGSLSFLVSVLAGAVAPGKIRSALCSQLTVHPVTNWFNQMKADTRMATWIRDGAPSQVTPVLNSLLGPDVARLFEGLSSVDVNSDPGPDGVVTNADQALNLMTWGVPFPNGVPCYSPTCHRVFGIYGPVYAHENLNQATPDAIQTVFGEISTKPFEQIAMITRKGIAVDAEGRDVYLKNHANLSFPIHFIAGALNQEFMPDTSLRTYEWLLRTNPDKAALYSRQVFKDYAHMDCFIGKNASDPIFKSILAFLDATGGGGA